MYQTPRFTNFSNIQSNNPFNLGLNPQAQLNLLAKYPSNQQPQPSLLRLQTQARTKTETKTKT